MITIKNKKNGPGLKSAVEEISGVDISVCFQCKKCSSGCPVAKLTKSRPSEIMRQLHLGAGNELLENDLVWMLRYVGDRFPVIPIPQWMQNPIDPISIRDVLHYLVAAADAEQVPAGAYDIAGPDTTSYRALLQSYAHVSGNWHTGLPVWGVNTAVASRVAAIALPVPAGLAADLVESLDYPMQASGTGLRDLVPDPPGGLLPIEEAITRSLSDRRPRPVNALADPHHLADSDPAWAGGDALRLRRLAG